jgi:hypothetical protein
LLETKATSPQQPKSISHEERLSFPARSGENKENAIQDFECKFIPTNVKVETVDTKRSPFVSTAPKAQETAHKPQIVQEVKQEAYATDDFGDEEEYNYGDDFEDEEIEEDIDSSDAHTEEKGRVDSQSVQSQKTSKPSKAREYDSEEDIIPQNIDRSDDEHSETRAVNIK